MQLYIVLLTITPSLEKRHLFTGRKDMDRNIVVKSSLEITLRP